MINAIIGEAGGDGDVGQVRDPELVWAMNLELPPGHERMDRAIVIAVGGADEPPSPSRVEIMLSSINRRTFLALTRKPR